MSFYLHFYLQLSFSLKGLWAHSRICYFSQMTF
jgi:hypothetical protein